MQLQLAAIPLGLCFHAQSLLLSEWLGRGSCIHCWKLLWCLSFMETNTYCLPWAHLSQDRWMLALWHLPYPLPPPALQHPEEGKEREGLTPQTHKPGECTHRTELAARSLHVVTVAHPQRTLHFKSTNCFYLPEWSQWDPGFNTVLPKWDSILQHFAWLSVLSW